MKEHPILFSAPMVQAILTGRKTMTRRVVKNQECVEFDKEGAIYVHSPKCPNYCEYACNGSSVGTYGDNPYGQVGSTLWVRETWAYDEPQVIYRYGYNGDKPPSGRWKPSIFMPRWASRITLEIADIRVERLQNITEEDCLNEWCNGGFIPDTASTCGGFYTAKDQFETLWDSINAKKYPWSSNPWVFVIEFKSVKP